MKTNITKEEALSLLRHAMMEPLGLLVYASEVQPFIQALYRAKREDPTLHVLQIRQTAEGIAICHDPISYPLSAPQAALPNPTELNGVPRRSEATAGTSEATAGTGADHDKKIDTGDS